MTDKTNEKEFILEVDVTNVPDNTIVLALPNSSILQLDGAEFDVENMESDAILNMAADHFDNVRLAISDPVDDGYHEERKIRVIILATDAGDKTHG